MRKCFIYQVFIELLLNANVLDLLFFSEILCYSIIIFHLRNLLEEKLLSYFKISFLLLLEKYYNKNLEKYFIKRPCKKDATNQAGSKRQCFFGNVIQNTMVVKKMQIIQEYDAGWKVQVIKKRCTIEHGNKRSIERSNKIRKEKKQEKNRIKNQ